MPSRLPLVCALLLGACAPPILSLAPPERAASASDYPEIYDRWTRVGRAISKTEFDTTLVVSATLRSPEFQGAYCARHCQAYALQGAEAEALHAAEKKRAEETFTFAVQAQGHSYGWTDLAATRSLWRVYLADDSGRVIIPTSIELIRPQKLAEAALFNHPMSSPFARAFQITFPRLQADGQPTLSPTTKRLTLTFSGPGGRIDLHWTLR